VNLVPLQCHACGGDVPLVAAPATRCVYCGASVAIPREHVEALALHAEARALRVSVEPRWRRMTAEASPWTEWIAVGLALLLPPSISAVAAFATASPLPTVDGLVFVAVPALAPGGVLWVWAIASRATAQRLHGALGAAPPKRAGGNPTCRSCGAPLPLEPGAVAATCAYCGVDSIVDAAARRPARAALGAEVRTLRDALRTYRMRVTLLGFGLAALAVPMAALAALIWIALRAAS